MPTEVARGIHRLRARLIDAGFTHGRHLGELVRTLPDGRFIAVRTGYTHAAYRITAMGRDRGARVGQCYVDVSEGTKLALRLDEIAEALCSDTMSEWPPHEVMKPSSTGWGRGHLV